MQRFQAGYRGSRYANGEDDSRAIRPRTINSRTLSTGSRSSVQELCSLSRGSGKGDKGEEVRRKGSQEKADGWGQAKYKAATRVSIMLPYVCACSTQTSTLDIGDASFRTQ